MAAREVVWTITNHTGQTLTYEGNSLSSGVMASQPTQSINAGAQGTFVVESDGLMTGAVGSVSYGIPGGTFVFSFSNPYAGNDTVSVACPNGYTAQTSQSTGNDNSVTSILSKV
jgi:hypothetical protein